MTIDKETRESRVLEAVIRVHTKTALPVGSKYISRVLNLSSATIRNVMFNLERSGLIRQPYTSAGRIPTDLGYRRYVDSMKAEMEIPCGSLFSRVKQYLNRKRFFEELIEASSHAISEMTSYTGIALSPTNKLYFDGTYHMLEQPEFKEVRMVRDFLKIIEEKKGLIDIMNRDSEIRGTKIHIGRENVYEELKNCTIITSTYTFKRHQSGKIGIIGPMRMQYERVVPLVEHLAEMTTEILEEITM